ncbi:MULTISPECIES: type III PLP-dependent enzyme [Micromonospora]|uniref:Diaminopimelate decarboxylase n=1 Tax=Micromonospora gifhornensis TaxID=84594 RepID=A0ABQ4IBE6_9ACTN|nr:MULTISPECIES: type III PLP-dependent enzyme [Micromonospora]PMR59276.1 diaminopimelate decarboxylase [Verrucosispora sp. ts21]GIJ15188.1 diaminopimelate decarboxylase [Micromonospora gifhornensis]
MADDVDVQGVRYEELAARYGTPLYVYDSAVLDAQFSQLRAALDPRLDFFFSLKANPNVAICARLAGLGAHAEVSSLTELLTARRAGVRPENIIFLGPGKSAEELQACLAQRIHAIVCESLGELRLIDSLARAAGTIAPVALRVNPNFSVKGSGLTMGGRPRQFGIDEDELMRQNGLSSRYPGVRLMGVHVYMGTRILDPGVVADNSRRIFELAERLSARLDFPLELVDVGGGLGVAYFDNEQDLDVDTLAGLLNPVLGEFRARHPGTRLVMELGRYLTAPSGIYVVRVRYLKSSLGQRFAVTDGGTHHHMAAVGIGSYVKRNFPIRLLGTATGAAEPWQVTGPLCTPNDTLGKNVMLPPLRTGDLLGVLRSGAYGPTASPVQFLSHGYPAEVLVHDGRPYLVRERDRPEDMMRRQHLPGALRARPAVPVR